MPNPTTAPDKTLTTGAQSNTKKAKKAKKNEKAASPPAADAKHSMGHANMPGMAIPGIATPTPNPPEKKADADAMQGMDHSGMQEMDHSKMPGMDHSSMSGMNHGGGSGMTMGPMQGGRAPADARSPDYSDGIGMGTMRGMDMADNASLGMLLVDQLESFHGSDANGQLWEAEGWYGNDRDKIWLRTEGERSARKLTDADVEVLWNRNVATFWGTQLGLRQDFGEGPSRTWAAFGVQGLAPYWFELEATAYVGQGGRTAARLRAEYELLFTQRLILQPEFEMNLYGRSDPARGIGSGLSNAELGLRLRYEFSRQFAPYIGVGWSRSFGTTADYARANHQPLLDRRIVAGLRFWF